MVRNISNAGKQGVLSSITQDLQSTDNQGEEFIFEDNREEDQKLAGCPSLAFPSGSKQFERVTVYSPDHLNPTLIPSVLLGK